MKKNIKRTAYWIYDSFKISCHNGVILFEIPYRLIVAPTSALQQRSSSSLPRDIIDGDFPLPTADVLHVNDLI